MSWFKSDTQIDRCISSPIDSLIGIRYNSLLKKPPDGLSECCH